MLSEIDKMQLIRWISQVRIRSVTRSKYSNTGFKWSWTSSIRFNIWFLQNLFPSRWKSTNTTKNQGKFANKCKICHASFNDQFQRFQQGLKIEFDPLHRMDTHVFQYDAPQIQKSEKNQWMLKILERPTAIRSATGSAIP